MRKKKRTTTLVKVEQTLNFKRFYWLYFLLLIFLTYEVGLRFAEPRVLPIKHIQLLGTCQRINPNQIKSTVQPQIKGLLSTNTKRLKEKLLMLPFVDEIVIKRLWPDTLQIMVTEQRLVARWGESLYLTSKGKIIAGDDKVPVNLPYFSGPDNQVDKMLLQYNALNQILEPMKLTITALSLNTRRSWVFTLSNGINLLIGRKDVNDRLSTLPSLLPKLAKKHGKMISAIDFRYPNGVAVHLKGEPQSAEN